MHYLINIGNTRVAVAEAKRLMDNPPPIEHYSPKNFLTEWRPAAVSRITAASVVPSLQKVLEANYLQCTHFVGAQDFPDVDFSLYGPGLGADRMANAAAARALCPNRAVLVVDCGTALNTVAVDTTGRFRGGVILPGRQTSLAALGRQTAQLPEINAEQKNNLFTPLGCNTEEGIRSGVNLMLLAAVARIIQQTRHEADFRDCQVFITGGDAPFYVQNLPKSLKAKLPPCPLTLFGISLATKTLSSSSALR